MAFEIYKPTYGSGVSLKTMSLADAASRVCEHDADELTCPACVRNHDIQMGRIQVKPVEASLNPAPLYPEWGHPLVNDMVDEERQRLSNRFREYGQTLELDLTDTIIDFQTSPGVSEIHVSRGSMSRQMWIRFPHPPARVVTEELALAWLEIAYPIVESGRKMEWVRTKRIPVKREYLLP